MFELRKASLSFGAKRVLDNVDVRLSPGERIGVLGPSGAGKSSLLKLAAGLLQPNTGTIINSFRHCVLVFQEPRLLPWRRVSENVEIPLLAQGINRQEAARRAKHWLARVGLADVGRHWPRELSGGMAQRVGLARAFALEPDCLLLDEPFSALDLALRNEMGQLCLQASSETGAALLCISHHPKELANIVHRCIHIENGQLHNHDCRVQHDAKQAPLPAGTASSFSHPELLLP